MRGTSETVISALLADNASRYGDAVWLRCPETGRDITYQSAYRSAQKIAKSLIAQGVCLGESVAMAAPNSVGGCIAFLAIVLAGGRATPMN